MFKANNLGCSAAGGGLVQLRNQTTHFAPERFITPENQAITALISGNTVFSCGAVITCPTQLVWRQLLQKSHHIPNPGFLELDNLHLVLGGAIQLPNNLFHTLNVGCVVTDNQSIGCRDTSQMAILCHQWPENRYQFQRTGIINLDNTGNKLFGGNV